MNALGYILAIAKLVASATPTGVDDRILEYVSRAYDEYVKVHGEPVTQAQLESLRTTPRW